jgi:hypothetical protein
MTEQDVVALFGSPAEDFATGKTWAGDEIVVRVFFNTDGCVTGWKSGRGDRTESLFARLRRWLGL